MQLKGKVALITGGARGMGRAIALRYADEGCDSVIVDVLDADGEKTVADIKAKGRDAIYLHCDVTRGASVKETVDKAIAKFNKIDILTNCAGVGTNPTPFLSTTEEEWDRVMNINCKGTFLTIFNVAPYMQKQKYGKIINIVSVAAFETGVANVHYHASKAAQASVTRIRCCRLCRGRDYLQRDSSRNDPYRYVQSILRSRSYGRGFPSEFHGKEHGSAGTDGNNRRHCQGSAIPRLRRVSLYHR